MKIVDIPAKAERKVAKRAGADVVIDNTFVQFLRISMESHEPCGKGAKQVRQYGKIMDILDAATPESKVLQFEDADFSVVGAAVEAMNWIPEAGRAMQSYYDAVDKAQDVPTPAKKKEVDN